MYKNLVRIRKKKKYTIYDLAKVINKSPANYYKKEKGEVVFSLKEALKIANFLNEDVELLFKE